MQDHLIPPHGGELVNLLATRERVLELQAKSRDWLSWHLTSRQLCDLELLLNGGFSSTRIHVARRSRRHLLPDALGGWEVVAHPHHPGCIGRVCAFDRSREYGRPRDPEGVMLAVLYVAFHHGIRYTAHRCLELWHKACCRTGFSLWGAQEAFPSTLQRLRTEVRLRT